MSTMAVTKTWLRYLVVAMACLRRGRAFTGMGAFPESRHFNAATVLHAGRVDRRSFLGALMAPALISASTFQQPQAANADDRLFKPNPLTNPLLEQIRIWEQAEADNIRFGGELAPGDAGNKGKVDAYPKLLVPILVIDSELQRVDKLVHGTVDDWREAMKILQQPKFEKLAFKKTFNAFADNIYYGDPDRANLYLGGGATPKTEQSLAYLLRNEMLDNIEALQAELAFLIKEKDTETDDLFRYLSNVNNAMGKYLSNVSPAEMKRARELLESS